MKTYTITKTTSLKIRKEFDNDKKLMDYFYGGVVNCWLADEKENEHLHYLITDEDDNVVFDHTYT